MTPEDRVALVKQLRTRGGFSTELNAADLIEADGKRLALAEKTIAAFRDWRVERDGYAGLPDAFDAILDSYDAAKESGL